MCWQMENSSENCARMERESEKEGEQEVLIHTDMVMNLSPIFMQ